MLSSFPSVSAYVLYFTTNPYPHPRLIHKLLIIVRNLKMGNALFIAEQVSLKPDRRFPWRGHWIAVLHCPTMVGPGILLCPESCCSQLLEKQLYTYYSYAKDT